MAARQQQPPPTGTPSPIYPASAGHTRSAGSRLPAPDRPAPPRHHHLGTTGELHRDHRTPGCRPDIHVGSHGDRSTLFSSSRTSSTVVVGMRKSSPSDARRRRRTWASMASSRSRSAAARSPTTSPCPEMGDNQSEPHDRRESPPSVRCSIRVAGRDLAFEQLRQLLNGDLHRAEHRIPLHSGAGDRPTETFYEVGIQRIRHTGQVCCTPERSPHPPEKIGFSSPGVSSPPHRVHATPGTPSSTGSRIGGEWSPTQAPPPRRRSPEATTTHQTPGKAPGKRRRRPGTPTAHAAPSEPSHWHGPSRKDKSPCSSNECRPPVHTRSGHWGKRSAPTKKENSPSPTTTSLTEHTPSVGGMADSVRCRRV
ncbi:conserved hypothetical protein (plasmid) [Rhodococcus jostii RHA1]|uniref:Uncharacterized protein n=1 Tax=Rhodococcus jostii (strain RHA1) TaxID=101510 RepID=Q0RZK7_RHOJR|nr:conserved hypothetical protein [Rhodococcus jostii RHA1]